MGSGHLLKVNLAVQSCFKTLYQGNYDDKVDGREVLETSRRAFSNHQSQHQTQIETSDVNQKPFATPLLTKAVPLLPIRRNLFGI